MTIVCPKCHRRFTLPEDKLPPQKSYRFLCRHCGTKIPVEAEAWAEKALTACDGPALGSAAHHPDWQAGPDGRGLEEAAEALQPDQEEAEGYWGEEAHQALVCVPRSPTERVVCDALEELGYWPVPLSDPQKVVEKIKFSLCELIVLDEEFACTSPDSNPVHRYLQPLPMSIRRGIFFVLIGNEFQTFDHLTAFVKSANLVVNSSDLKELKQILEKAIGDNERFYRAFSEVMKDTGKL